MNVLIVLAASLLYVYFSSLYFPHNKHIDKQVHPVSTTVRDSLPSPFLLFPESPPLELLPLE